MSKRRPGPGTVPPPVKLQLERPPGPGVRAVTEADLVGVLVRLGLTPERAALAASQHRVCTGCGAPSVRLGVYHLPLPWGRFRFVFYALCAECAASPDRVMRRVERVAAGGEFN